MSGETNLLMASDYQIATLAGKGGHTLDNSADSPEGVKYTSVYGNIAAVIEYDSAAEPNFGDVSFTNINVPAGVTYTAIMKNIHIVSGEVVANIL